MKLSPAAALAFGVILAAPMAANAHDGAATFRKHRIHAHHAYKAVETEKVRPSSTAQVPRFFPNIARLIRPAKATRTASAVTRTIATKGASAATPADPIGRAFGPAFPLEALR